MRAVVLDGGFGIEALRQVDLPEPQPGPGEVVLRVRAVSLNYRDLLVVQGTYHPKLPLPRIPCSDAAGEVVAVGPNVNRWAVGDRVMAIFMQRWLAGELTEAATRSALGGESEGVLAEYICLHEDGLVAIPEVLNFTEAATLPCAAVTAWHALTQAGATAGQTVLLQGTGGVSMFAAQFARVMGLRVLMTSGSEEKRTRLANEFGIRETVHYRQQPDWEKWVRERTGGTGVDLVLEVGGAGTLERSVRAVRVGGTIALIGVLSGVTGTINPLPILMRSVRLQGIFVGSRSHFEAMNRAIQHHQIHPVIDRVFPLADAVSAWRHLESGQHMGKIVIALD